MVPHERHSGLFPKRDRPHNFLKPPVEDRLRWWFERTAKRSAFMRTAKQATAVQLKKKIADALGLSSTNVTILEVDLRVELWSEGRNVPLCVLNKN